MKKTSNKYYLSVEGETEKWYFEHLQKLINDREEISHTVKFDIKINKSIASRAKSVSAPYKVKAFHICDYESNEKVHTKQFDKILQDLNSIRKINKNLDYRLGYSNFSFDLWMILHKNQQIGSVSHRKQYIKGINNAYGETFQFIDDYKEEKTFKRILSQITLEDVIDAVNNGNEIRNINKQKSKDKYRKHGQFEFYTENPNMTINECVEQILNECGVIKR